MGEQRQILSRISIEVAPPGYSGGIFIFDREDVMTPTEIKEHLEQSGLLYYTLNEVKVIARSVGRTVIRRKDHHGVPSVHVNESQYVLVYYHKSLSAPFKMHRCTNLRELINAMRGIAQLDQWKVMEHDEYDERTRTGKL